MNREAVDIALGLSGNMPLSDDDKRFNNLIYVFCKQLYLPALFNSLAEIDWRSARKEGILKLSERWTVRNPGKYYYEMPADCVRPLMVDDNEVEFVNQEDFIVTPAPAHKLFYVFHKRRLGGLTLVQAANRQDRDRAIILKRPDNPVDAGDPAALYTRSEEAIEETDEDFPEWEYTDYEPDFWTYFSYRLAAGLIPKLRADDAAASKTQALLAIAAQKGEEAIQRSRASSTNPHGQYKSWAEASGLTGAVQPVISVPLREKWRGV